MATLIGNSEGIIVGAGAAGRCGPGTTTVAAFDDFNRTVTGTTDWGTTSSGNGAWYEASTGGGTTIAVTPGSGASISLPDSATERQAVILTTPIAQPFTYATRFYIPVVPSDNIEGPIVYLLSIAMDASNNGLNLQIYVSSWAASISLSGGGIRGYAGGAFSDTLFTGWTVGDWIAEADIAGGSVTYKVYPAGASSPSATVVGAYAQPASVVSTSIEVDNTSTLGTQTVYFRYITIA